ncbi:MAG: DNA cytosine methyltransferase [Alphaproteobacteria bacterium]
MTPPRVLDLFSGIGGFSFGLERAGFRTAAFCEISPFCRRVLAKHWPEVPIYDDIRALTADRLANNGIIVDVICGGFPCQDISVAGRRAGIDGRRSGLWREYARLVDELRPSVILVENVPGLLTDGLGRVLGDLAALGYDAEWHCIPAAAIGAPHIRDRVWIVAYPGRQQHEGNCASLRWKGTEEFPRPSLADTDGAGLEVRLRLSRHDVAEFAATVGASWWLAEPDVDRVAHGVPKRVDRIAALGNAVVPQIVEMIGRAILAADPELGRGVNR